MEIKYGSVSVYHCVSTFFLAVYKSITMQLDVFGIFALRKEGYFVM